MIIKEGRLVKLQAKLDQHLSKEQLLSSSLSPQEYHLNVEYTLCLVSRDHDSSISPEHAQPVQDHVPLNALVGQKIELVYLNRITCLYCGRSIKKTYSDGYCYPCFIEQPSAAECIIRPELCLAHEGKGRDPEWEKQNHLQDHMVYLALSSKYKIGVTRDWPTRWLDQGADAIKLVACTPYRQLAGLIEVELAQHYSDKLSWQAMLKGDRLDKADLNQEVKRCLELLPDELTQYGTQQAPILHFNYPIQAHPQKVKSQKLDKVQTISGTLLGIKGQYLIFDEHRVVNIRSHSASHVQIKFGG